jgi:glycogen(starch) synthase
MSSTLPDSLFEASWEVCNKVGGIHTVITTKIASAQSTFTKYYTLGPWLAENPTFHEEPLPKEFEPAVKKANEQGVGVHYGHWLTDGQPATFLIDWQGLVPRLNEMKSRFWDQYQLDSLHTEFYDVDQPLMWSAGVGMFVAAVAETQQFPLLFHGHEWLSSGAFLILNNNPFVRSVFTTHATVLGRAISSDGSDLYGNLATINPDQAAYDHGVTTKHQLEKLAAQNATIFTTVSGLTGREAEALLGKKPDVITENGLDPELFPPFDALCLQHRVMREELHNFSAAYFFPSYRFDLNQTSYLFTMGRYEMHNKGYDVFLQALGALNETMKKEKSPKTVIACFFVPGDAVGVRGEVSFQLAAHKHITTLLANYTSLQQRELYQNLWSESNQSANLHVLPPHVLDQIRQFILRMPTHDKVPLSPYEMRHQDQDPIFQTAAKYNLNNTEEDRVKVVFFPAYFDGFDGIFNRALYDIVSGCDLGVFPSFYEPWGYTPMESLVLGIPAITSDLAGFGLAVAEHAPELTSFVVSRESRPDEEAAAVVNKLIADYLRSSERKQLLERMAAYQAVQSFSWMLLYQKYQESYKKAFDAHQTHPQ